MIRRTDWFMIGIGLMCCIMLTWLSLVRYLGYNAGMLDLGVMAQSIWSGTQSQPLLHTAPDIGARSRLNVHVELIYFLFVPFYALWPDPRLLLIAQAALFGLGALPVYWIALRRTESVYAARCLALVYLFYPVAQTAVLFDFHGDTLAMPLLLFALDALDRRAWRRYALFIALALSCKFYVALPVALIGVYLWLWGSARRAGALTFAAGVGYGLVAFLIVRRLFAPTFVEAVAAPTTIGGYLAHYFGEFDQLWVTLDARLINALIVFGPALLVAWRGWRWLLPGIPLTLVALLSTGPGGVSDYRYHHYAIVVPFIVMAAIDGTVYLKTLETRDGGLKTKQSTPNLQSPISPRRRRTWRGDLGLTTAIVLICSALLVDTPLNPFFWLGVPGQGLDSSVYGITSRDRMKDQFLAEHVTPGIPLAASMFLAPHVINRSTLYLVRYADDPGAERLPRVLPRVDAVVTDALFDYYIPLGDGAYGGGLDYEREAIGLLLRDPSFGLVTARDGLLLFRRDVTPAEQLTQQVEVLPSSALSTTEQRFGDSLELVQHAITRLDQRRFRASFTWRALRPLDTTLLVAVSSLDGVEGARIVHLPTYALQPTTAWQPGQLVRETFDLQLPPDIVPGQYTWRVGWYVVRSPFAAATDARSLLPGSEAVAVGAIEVR